jgi:nucleoside-diphosphate-sugar epimerase/predicted dehydrogenase
VEASFDAFLGSAAARHLDGVIVALPHHLHEAATCAAFAAGLHVLCEKPAALNAASLARMRATGDAAGKVFVVCHYRRRLPVVAAVKDMVERCWLGGLREVDWQEGQPYAWPAESLAQLRRACGGEELYDIGAHVFDVLCHWLGDLQVTTYEDDSQSGTAADFRVGLRSASGVGVRVRLSRLAHLPQRVVLQFDGGVVTWSLGERDALRVESSRLPLGGARLGFGPAPELAGMFADELRGFAAAMRGTAPTMVSWDEAGRYVSIFDQCECRRTSPPRISSPPMPWPWPDRRVAVTGASGFIGGRLVEVALERGLDVCALAHSPKSCVRLMRLCVEPQLCDVMDRGALEQAFEGSTAVFHCATSWDATMRDTAVVGTRNVLAAAAACSVKVVVVLGSMMGHGCPPSAGSVDESYAVTVHDDLYGRVKRALAVEAQVFASRHPEVHVVVLEPTCVFGPWSTGFVIEPVRRMLAGEFYLMGEGRGRANLVYVDDLVEAMFAAVAAAAAVSGGRYLVNAEEYAVTWGEYLRPICECLGVTPPSIAITDVEALAVAKHKPKGAIRLLREAVRNYPPAGRYLAAHPVFRVAKRLREYCRHQRHQAGTDAVVPACTVTAAPALVAASVPPLAFARIYTSQAVYSSQAFRTATGWRPTMAFDEAMKQTLAWVQVTWPRE